MPLNAPAGTPFTLTATAEDAFGNIASTYAGTVVFSSNDSHATLPTIGTVSNGTARFSITLRTAGNEAVTVSDTSASTFTGSSTISITALGTTHFAVTAPATVMQSASFLFTVTARDSFNNLASSYSGTVDFSSSDSAAVVPLPTTLVNGVGIFSAALSSRGNQTLTATDLTNGIFGISSTIDVVIAPATHFYINAPTTAQAGSSFVATITALNQSNATATGYTGTVHFACSDPQSVVPADATLINGTGVFSFFLATAGNQTISANDTAAANISGVSGLISVSPLNASHFNVSVTPGSGIAGGSGSITVTAQDQFNNTVSAYAGVVKFTSTDPAATLPAASAHHRWLGRLQCHLADGGQPDRNRGGLGQQQSLGRQQRRDHQSRRRCLFRGDRPHKRHGRRRLRVHRDGQGPIRQHRHQLRWHGGRGHERSGRIGAASANAYQRDCSFQRHAAHRGPPTYHRRR